MRLVLLGAPGSGKGTQADLLKAKYDCVHISTGDILRKNLQNKTELGYRAEPFMNKGELVPDALIVDMVEERLCEGDVVKGFLMDGFPRTISQADELDKMLNKIERPLDAVLLLNIDDELVIRRLTNRRTCRTCGKILSLLKMGAGTQNCPDCGGELYLRDDDNEQVIRNRIQIYKEQTEPLAAWYEGKGILYVIEVKEGCTPEDTFREIEAVLGL